MTNKDILRQYVDTGIGLPEEQIKLLNGGLLATYIRKRKIAIESGIGGMIENVYELKLLYPDLKVPGDLDLSGSDITKLPDNLTVGGELDLSDTKITRLPDNLKVGGDLYLSYKIKLKSPDNLIVKGKIFINDE